MSGITISKAVIHALNKEQHKPIKPSDIRTKLLDPDHSAVFKVVDGVISIYGTRKNNAHFGTFNKGEGRGSFPDSFEKYWKGKSRAEEEFLGLTHNAMDRFYDKASSNHASSGGYILFAEYTQNKKTYLLIAMVKQKPGITLSENLEPEELMHLDLSKVHQAARISFSKRDAYEAADATKKQELNYLSFVSPSTSKAASGYFVMALGCSQGTASATATKTLITESRKFFQDNPDLKPNKEYFMAELLEHLRAKEEKKESVKLSEIENIARKHIPEDLSDEADDIAEKLLSHLNSEDCGVPVEFPVSSTALKRFTHISGEADSWKTSFNRTALGTDPSAEVYWDKENNKLILKGVPSSMRTLIENELKERQRD